MFCQRCLLNRVKSCKTNPISYTIPTYIHHHRSIDRHKIITIHLNYVKYHLCDRHNLCSKIQASNWQFSTMQLFQCVLNLKILLSTKKYIIEINNLSKMKSTMKTCLISKNNQALMAIKLEYSISKNSVE
jgi:hypothetical protein